MTAPGVARDTAVETSEELRGCSEALAQCRALVRALGPARYALPIGRHASIGAHLRHCLDHFDRFFEGLALGTVDYDARERRAPWETNAEVALEVISEFENRLAELPPMPGRTLTVWQSVASGADAKRASVSSPARELAFLSSHTIHHLALMRALVDLAGWDDAAPAEVGVAYSTRAHHAASGQ